MYKALFAFLLYTPVAVGQTRPHAYQLNPAQVRVSGDQRSGTLVSAVQVQDDRYIRSSDSVSWITYSSVYYVICFTTFVRIANELNPDDALPGVTVSLTTCATDDGMVMYLSLPDWKDWYESEVAKLQ